MASHQAVHRLLLALLLQPEHFQAGGASVLFVNRHHAEARIKE